MSDTRFTEFDREVLAQIYPDFDAWVAAQPPAWWARYDLSACKLGWVAAEQMIDRKPASCHWRESDPWGAMPGTWDADCGLTWYLEEGGLAQNEMHFCPKCGKRIEEVKFPVDEFDNMVLNITPQNSQTETNTERKSE